MFTTLFLPYKDKETVLDETVKYTNRYTYVERLFFIDPQLLLFGTNNMNELTREKQAKSIQKAIFVLKRMESIPLSK